jgi:hypothetical protein
MTTKRMTYLCALYRPTDKTEIYLTHLQEVRLSKHNVCLSYAKNCHTDLFLQTRFLLSLHGIFLSNPVFPLAYFVVSELRKTSDLCKGGTSFKYRLSSILKKDCSEFLQSLEANAFKEVIRGIL